MASIQSPFNENWFWMRKINAVANSHLAGEEHLSGQRTLRTTWPSETGTMVRILKKSTWTPARSFLESKVIIQKRVPIFFGFEWTFSNFSIAWPTSPSTTWSALRRRKCSCPRSLQNGTYFSVLREGKLIPKFIFKLLSTLWFFSAYAQAPKRDQAQPAENPLYFRASRSVDEEY